MVSKKEKYLVSAQKLIERGQWDKALAEYAKVVQEDPKDARTWLKMAEVHAKRGANTEAADIYMRTGDLYVEQGFAQKAVAVYKNVLKLSPGAVPAHLKVGALFNQLGLVSDAVQQFESAAAALQRLGKTAEAAAALRQAVDIQPDNVILRVKLAECASQAGLIDEAVREFEKAADQLKAQGRADESLRVLERLMFLQPENFAKARELAEAYIARGTPRLALPKLQACLNGDPNDPRTLSLLARALEQLGQLPKAVSVLKELVRLCDELGRTAERDAAVLRGLTLDPTDGDLLDAAGRHQLRVGNTTAAGEATPPPVWSHGQAPFETGPLAVKRGGTGAAVVDLGGVVRAPLGLTPSAASSGRVAAPAGPSADSGAHFHGDGPGRGGAEAGAEVSRILAEADVFVKYGLLERAADHLMRVFELEPEQKEAREQLITVLQRLGRKDEAAWHDELLTQQLARVPSAVGAGASDSTSVSLSLESPDGFEGAAHTNSAGGLDGGTSSADRDAGQVSFGPLFDESTFGEFLPGHSLSAVGAAQSLGVSGDDMTFDQMAVSDDHEAEDAADLEIGHAVNLAIDHATHGANHGETDDAGDPAADMLTPPPVARWPRPVDPQDGEDVVISTDFDAEVDSGDVVSVVSDATPPPEEAHQDVEFSIDDGSGEAGGVEATPPLVRTPMVFAAPQLEEGADGSGGVEGDDRDEDAATAFSEDVATMTGDPELVAAAFAEFDEEELSAELDQASFFLSQAMPDEARAVLEDVESRFPGDTRVAAKLREVEGARRPPAKPAADGADAPGAPDRTAGGDSVTTSRILSNPILGSTIIERPLAAADRRMTPSPRMVMRGGESSDSSTHADLAIAYKGMGLLDAAIAELKLLAQDEKQEVFALTTMGECFEAKNSFTEAIIRYKRALNCEQITAEENRLLYFLLGAAFEKLGDVSEALYFYEKVLKRDPKFRDVDLKVAELRPRLVKRAR